ncbi:exosome complex component mtr3 [Anaeramoeba ignava]|uniref:Exosome complex component mtr3 n=1 Tax=Anaeramoeba ignava TaxID=1746090 RepID=A0A9Q0LZT3_ANAIG|nr:exosome complex component mtr3 [Anaeramoeba ignava]
MQKVVLDGNKRLDGRSFQQIRHLYMQQGVNSRASGSAYIESGNTKIICSIFGPRQRKKKSGVKGQINVDFRFCSFANKDETLHKYASLNEKNIAFQIEQTVRTTLKIELLPKSEVDICVLVLQDDGSVLASSLNCVVLALVDAGFEIFDLVSSCQVIKIQNELFIDSTYKEEEESTGIVMISLMPSLSEIAHILQTGEISQLDMIEATKICLDGCAVVYSLIKDLEKLQVKRQIGCFRALPTELF